MGSRRKAWRSVPANGVVSVRSLRSRGDCPSWALVRLPPPSCQLVPAIRGGRPSPHCRAQTQARDPFRGYTFRAPGRSSGTTASAGPTLQAVKAIVMPSGLPVRPELIPAAVTRMLGYRPVNVYQVPGARSWKLWAYHLTSAAYQQVSRCVTTSAGIPGPASGEGIDQPD